MYPSCVNDLEILAQKTMDPHCFRYAVAGADEETTVKRNRAAFERLLIRPEILSKSVEHVDLRTSLINGKFPISLPICVSPSGFHMNAHPRAEVATAEACASKDTVMVLSSFSNVAMEEVKTSGVTLWQNIYMWEHPSKTIQMIRRAEKAGVAAFVVTCDIAVLGLKRHILLTDENVQKAVMSNPLPHYTTSELMECVASSPASTWDYFRWICESTELPVIAKGILTALDARRAVQNGAQGVIVSNHGGRQLDSASASIECLSEVVREVSGRCDVYLDGGIRNGNDVFKALALGAKAAFIGRPVLWGLAYDGAKGVEKVISMLENELKTTMGLAGCQRLSDIGSEKVYYGSRM